MMLHRLPPFSSLIKPVAALVLVTGLAGCATTDGLSSTSSTVDAVTPDVTLNHFVDTRLATIRKEAAVGYGENLDALAELMGMEDKIAFGAWMQLNYDSLFTGLESPSDLITRIEHTMPST